MINVSHRGQMIAAGVSIADNFWSKLCGYMFRQTPHVPGILFIGSPSTSSIHTLFMFFSIDVIFMNGKHEVIKVYRDLRPWRHTSFHFKATSVLELPAGQFPLSIKEGDVLEVNNV